MKLVLRTAEARRVQAAAGERKPMGPTGVDRLMQRERGHAHWAHEYAARLMRQVPPDRPALIQSSMSPTGPFHIGNFRDSVTAHLVHRAVLATGRSATVLLSFDDFDPRRRRPAELAAGTASAPLADGGPAVLDLCQDYIRELRAVGIAVQDAGAETSHVEMSQTVWRVHHQAQRYRAGEYVAEQRRFLDDRRRVAGLLGVDSPEKLFSPYCLQCGRNTTSVLGARRGTIRYSCRGCGAHVVTDDLREIKPVWALDWTVRVVHEGIDCEPAGHDHCSAGSTMDRTQPLYDRYLRRPQPVIVPYGLVRQGADVGKVSGSRGGGLCVRHLLRLMPAALVLWMYAAPDVRSDIRVSLERSAVLRRYDEFDRFTAAAHQAGRARELWRLLSDQPPPPPTTGFRRTAGTLSACLFDIPAAVQELIAQGERPSVQRVEHALRAMAAWPLPAWLPERPADPDPERCRQLLHVLRSQGADARLDAVGYRTLYGALFGSAQGPSVRGLVRRLGAAAVLDALQRYIDAGERPLRERALAALEAARIETCSEGGVGERLWAK